MRWFGPKWGAPICELAEEATPPLGQLCFGCEDPIGLGHRGFLIPHTGENVDIEKPWHLHCLLGACVPR